MKKVTNKKINLQLFADEGGTEPAETNPPATGGEESKPNPDEEKKYSDKDLDELLNKKFSKWQEKKAKEVDEAGKLAAMTAQEQSEYKIEKLQEEINKYKEKEERSQMISIARKMCSDEEISIGEELLDILVTTDAEKTKSSVESFISLFKDAVKSAVGAALKGETPKAGNTQTVTKEQIMAIKDTNERQKAIKENIELFK